MKINTYISKMVIIILVITLIVLNANTSFTVKATNEINLPDPIYPEVTASVSETLSDTTSYEIINNFESTDEVLEDISDGEIKYTQEDLDAMALVIYQEAGGNACSDETRIMVGNVVLNRVNHPSFPNTIEEVLLQKGQYGELYWTGLIWPDRAKYESDAVDRAYLCAQEVLEGTMLLPTDVIWQAEFPQGTEVVKYIDGIYFCK